MTATVAAGMLVSGCGQAGTAASTDDTGARTTTTDGFTQQTTTTAAPAIMAWTDLAPSGPTPDARSGVAMAYDPLSDKVILFGGWDADTDFADTWAYDPSTNAWTDLAPAGDTPPARALHQLVYDSWAGGLILFGGKSDAGRFGDTWVYDPGANTWAAVTGSAAPSPRSAHAMANDTDFGETILFGGYDGTSVLADTWAFDSGAGEWTQMVPDGDVPAARSAHAMVYDPGTETFIMFGGSADALLDDTWAYDPFFNTWTDLAQGPVPAPRGNHRMVYDESTGMIILYGGFDGEQELYDTWAYDPATNTWTDLDPLGPPPAREEHGMAYVGSLGAVVVFGGLDHPADRDLGDTWALSEFVD